MSSGKIFRHLAIIMSVMTILGCVSAFSSKSVELSKSGVAHLRKHGDATQLIVDGKPYLVLGGELGNSSSSTLDYLKPIWPRLIQMNLNTVLAPVYWDLIEPEEGKFDFTLVDGLIAGARQHDMRLVLLWFGSWKNSMSCYAPAWVKTNQKRFSRARLKTGQAMEILSVFDEANCEADTRAFAELMRYIRKVDGNAHTVIMVQVENEVGMLTDARDYSVAANRAFGQQVPKELIDYLERHKDTLIPEFRQVWEEAGFKTSGTWEEVFGRGFQTDEIFMAWHYARYINRVAAAGKAEYPLPMFVNAALIRPGYKPGQYPSAGPLPHLLDIWRAGGPQIDFFSPDIYLADFADWCQQYHRSGNPLFIPEARMDAAGAVNVFYAIGQHDAIGFSPFGVDSADSTESGQLAKSYEILSQLAPLILESQGSGAMAGVLLDEEQQTQEINLGQYKLKVSHDCTFRWSPRPAEGQPWPRVGGIIISVGPGEYVVAGSGIIVTFQASPASDPNTAGETAGILSIQEGKYIKGRWVGGRWLNGDQSHQGRHLRIPAGSFGIQRVKLYRYR